MVNRFGHILVLGTHFGHCVVSGAIASSNIILAALSVDRWIAIRFPYAYPNLNRFVHIGLISAGPILFMYDVLSKIFGVTNSSSAWREKVIGALFCIFVMLLVNIIVYRTARKQKARIQAEQVSVATNSNTTDQACRKVADQNLKKYLSIFYACFGCAIGV